MADVVISDNEIKLGDTRFPVRGQIKPYLVSTYPGKVTFGDYSKDSEQVASNLIWTDQRGGLLVEEMDEATQLDRHWWSTLQTRHKGYIPLPKLATEATLPTVTTLAVPSNTGMENGTLQAEAVDQSYTTGDDSEGTFYGVNWSAQTFTISKELTATKVSIKMCRVGSPGTITLSLRATSAGVPTGADLTSSTTDGNTLTTVAAGEWREIDFADYLLTPGVYAIVVRALTSDGSNYVNWRQDVTSPTYTLGQIASSSDSGGTWTGASGSDHMFYVYGTWYTVDNWTGGTRSGTQKDAGTYSLTLLNDNSYQDLAFISQYQSRVFEITVKVYASAASTGRIGIDDVVSGTPTYSSYHAGSSAWVALTVRRQLAAAATRLRVYFYSDTASPAYFDTISISEQPTTGSITGFCDFNSNTYMHYGNILTKLNTSTGASWDYLYSLPATITQIISSVGTNLYIFLGDSAYYWYMSTAEAFTQTNVANAQWGVHWSNMLFKINTTGQLSYSATPNSATPTFTNNGLLPLATSDCQGLTIYRDADQNEIIYASTKQGWWAHDYANAKWLQTLAQFPTHVYGGKGFCWWHDSSYISTGLEVLKYVAASTSTITACGLNRDDGLPIEYQGEIVALIKGHDFMYALVDSSLLTGTGTSGVYEYDGLGWRNIWLGSTTDDTMHAGIVSSTYAYRLWFDHDDKVYYMPLSRTNANPVKDSTSTYAAAGVHYTPWFDAATAQSKTALRFVVECKGMSANETITVTYRINHTYTDIASGWTALVSAITSSGETSTSFASGAGIEFRSIQFKAALARGSTTTNTPIILRMNLVYVKRLDIKWGWAALVDCSREYKGNTSSQLDTALKTIIALKTLSDFTFRDESGGTMTYKVLVSNASGGERTGEDFRNTYNIILIAP